MLWFRNKKKEEQAIIRKEVEAEVARHKKSAKKTIDDAKKAANKVNRIFDENGFTVKIFIGMGGRDPKQKLNKAGTH